jgi:hypothetical protein
MFTFKTDDYGDIVFNGNREIELSYDKEMWLETFIRLLQTRKGEYFLNTKEGMDFEPFFKKSPDRDEMIRALTSVGSQFKDFLRYNVIEFSFNDAERKAFIKIDIYFNDGNKLTIDREVSI